MRFSVVKRAVVSIVLVVGCAAPIAAPVPSPPRATLAPASRCPAIVVPDDPPAPPDPPAARVTLDVLFPTTAPARSSIRRGPVDLGAIPLPKEVVITARDRLPAPAIDVSARRVPLDALPGPIDADVLAELHAIEAEQTRLPDARRRAAWLERALAPSSAEARACNDLALGRAEAEIEMLRGSLPEHPKAIARRLLGLRRALTEGEELVLADVLGAALLASSDDRAAERLRVEAHYVRAGSGFWARYRHATFLADMGQDLDALALFRDLEGVAGPPCGATEIGVRRARLESDPAAAETAAQTALAAAHACTGEGAALWPAVAACTLAIAASRAHHPLVAITAAADCASLDGAEATTIVADAIDERGPGADVGALSVPEPIIGPLALAVAERARAKLDNAGARQAFTVAKDHARNEVDLAAATRALAALLPAPTDAAARRANAIARMTTLAAGCARESIDAIDVTFVVGVSGVDEPAIEVIDAGDAPTFVACLRQRGSGYFRGVEPSIFRARLRR